MLKKKKTYFLIYAMSKTGVAKAALFYVYLMTVIAMPLIYIC